MSMSTRQAICFVLLLKDWNCGTVLLTLVVVERLELLGQRVADHPDAPEPDDGQRRPERRRRTAGRLADVGGGHVAAALAGVDDAAAVDAGVGHHAAAPAVDAAVVDAVVALFRLETPSVQVARERRERTLQPRRSLQVDPEDDGRDSKLQFRKVVAGARLDVAGLGHLAAVARLGRQGRRQGRRQALPARGDAPKDHVQHDGRRRAATVVGRHVAHGTGLVPALYTRPWLL